jgi:hypothetical protein
MTDDDRFVIHCFGWLPLAGPCCRRQKEEGSHRWEVDRQDLWLPLETEGPFLSGALSFLPRVLLVFEALSFFRGCSINFKAMRSSTLFEIAWDMR